MPWNLCKKKARKNQSAKKDENKKTKRHFQKKRGLVLPSPSPCCLGFFQLLGVPFT